MLSVNELSPLGQIINIIKVGLFSQKNQRGDKYRPIYLSACHVKLPGLSLHLLSFYQIPFPQLNLDYYYLQTVTKMSPPQIHHLKWNDLSISNHLS